MNVTNPAPPWTLTLSCPSCRSELLIEAEDLKKWYQKNDNSFLPSGWYEKSDNSFFPSGFSVDYDNLGVECAHCQTLILFSDKDRAPNPVKGFVFLNILGEIPPHVAMHAWKRKGVRSIEANEGNEAVPEP